MAALAQPNDQETAIRKVLSSVPLPEGIKLRRLEFRNDSFGDPAVFVVYAVADSSKSDEERGKELSLLSTATVRPLWQLGLPLIPYADFVTV